MRTAISGPGTLFARVDQAAQAHGISPSEFFIKAAERYLADLAHDSVVERVNLALAAESAQGDQGEPSLTAYSKARLAVAPSAAQSKSLRPPSSATSP